MEFEQSPILVPAYQTLLSAAATLPATVFNTAAFPASVTAVVESEQSQHVSSASEKFLVVKTAIAHKL